MARVVSLLLVCCFALGLKGNSASERDTEIFQHVASAAHPPEAIPSNGTINIGLIFYLVAIRDVDKDRNEVEVVAWIGSRYNNSALGWTANFSEDKHIVFPAYMLWLPDLYVYNAMSEPKSTMFAPPHLQSMVAPEGSLSAFVSNTGQVAYVQPLTFRFWCNLKDVDKAEGSVCTVRVGSWMHDVNELDFTEPGYVDSSEFYDNPHYEVVRTSARRMQKMYTCCAEMYASIDYNITIREKGDDDSWFNFW